MTSETEAPIPITRSTPSLASRASECEHFIAYNTSEGVSCEALAKQDKTVYFVKKKTNNF